MTDDSNRTGGRALRATERPRSRTLAGGPIAVLVAASVALVVVAVVAFSIGRLSTLAEPTPSNTSAEAGFARDMQVHHQQGVELAMIVRDAPTTPTCDCSATTSRRRSRSRPGRCTAGSPSGTSPSSGPTVDDLDVAARRRRRDARRPRLGDGGAAATHEPGGPMPGLATPEQIAELQALEGVEAERMFLELMIAHHQGAVEMAEAVLARSDYLVVVSLAESIVASQARRSRSWRTCSPSAALDASRARGSERRSARTAGFSALRQRGAPPAAGTARRTRRPRR